MKGKLFTLYLMFNGYLLGAILRDPFYPAPVKVLYLVFCVSHALLCMMFQHKLLDEQDKELENHE